MPFQIVHIPTPQPIFVSTPDIIGDFLKFLISIVVGILIGICVEPFRVIITSRLVQRQWTSALYKRSALTLLAVERIIAVPPSSTLALWAFLRGMDFELPGELRSRDRVLYGEIALSDQLSTFHSNLIGIREECSKRSIDDTLAALKDTAAALRGEIDRNRNFVRLLRKLARS